MRSPPIPNLVVYVNAKLWRHITEKFSDPEKRMRQAALRGITSELGEPVENPHLPREYEKTVDQKTATGASIVTGLSKRGSKESKEPTTLPDPSGHAEPRPENPLTALDDVLKKRFG